MRPIRSGVRADRRRGVLAAYAGRPDDRARRCIRPRHSAASSGIDTAQAILILVLFVLLGLVALVIDRRASAGLGAQLCRHRDRLPSFARGREGLGVSLTLLGLAVVVLGLSAGWRSLRRASAALSAAWPVARNIFRPPMLAFVP